MKKQAWRLLSHRLMVFKSWYQSVSPIVPFDLGTPLWEMCSKDTNKNMKYLFMNNYISYKYILYITKYNKSVYGDGQKENTTVKTGRYSEG